MVPLTATDWQKYGATFKFTTDPYYPGGDYSLDSVTITACKASGSVTAAPLDFTRVSTGLLQGTHDTVYHVIPVGSDTSLKTNIALWSDALGSYDFDLYVRCNAFPTADSYDYRGYSADAQEFLSINNYWCLNGSWYVAVNSYSGWGSYALSYSLMNAYQSSVELCVDVDAYHTADWYTAELNTLRQAAKYVYGMTEGQFMIPKMHLWPYGVQCAANNNPIHLVSTPSVNCNPPALRSHCSSLNGTGQVYVCQDDWANPRTIAHEIGHCSLQLRDEYSEDANHVSKAQCSHTIMSGSTSDNVCSGQFVGGFSEHPKDPEYGAGPFDYPYGQPYYTGWYQLHMNKGLYQIFYTPSNYAFQNFDFNGAISAVYGQ
jgi:hypothetical protein